MEERQEAMAKAEATARDINEDIGVAHEEAGRDGYVRVVCECGGPSCTRVVAITTESYEAVRSDGRRFVVTKGHVHHEVDIVVEETGRYVVVEKRPGTPADIAEGRNPRP